MVGQRRAAVAACLRTRRWTASALRRRPVRVGNSGSSRLAGAFGHPDAQHRLGGRGERDGAVPAALAEAADVGAGAEADVAAVESGQLGDAQPGLRCQQQQGPVAAAFPPGPVAARRCRASISVWVRNETSGLSNRLAGMARTRWMSAACSGWRRAA